MHFTPSGSVYRVTGQIIVRSVRPEVVTTVMQISGIYNPASVPAQFVMTGAPLGGGNAPHLTGTLAGSRMYCRLSGIPTLGITSLYITER